MAKTVKAGCPELRKLMRRLQGYSLVSTSKSHACLVDPQGRYVRMPDGRKLTFPCSPQNGTDEANNLLRKLARLGIQPRR